MLTRRNLEWSRKATEVPSVVGTMQRPFLRRGHSYDAIVIGSGGHEEVLVAVFEFKIGKEHSLEDIRGLLLPSTHDELFGQRKAFGKEVIELTVSRLFVSFHCSVQRQLSATDRSISSSRKVVRFHRGNALSGRTSSSVS